jgi:hypothetical protein
LPDRMVEVTYALPDHDGVLPDHDDRSRWLGGFSGEVSNVVRDTAMRDHLTVYFKEDGARPHHGSVTFWPDSFEGAEVKTSGLTLEEVQREHEEGDGAIWEIHVRQAGVLISLFVYV